MCLLLAVGLAGCSAVVGDDPSDRAPGLDDGELTDVEELRAAHAESLLATGFEVELNATTTVVREGGREEVETRQRVHVAPDGEQYHFQQVGGGATTVRAVAWGNRTDEYRSLEIGTDDHRLERREPMSGERLAGTDFLAPHLTAPYEVENVDEGDDPTRVTLRSTGLPEEGEVFPADAEVHDYRATLVVDTEGRIHHLRATGEYTVDGQRVPLAHEFRIASVGDPGVERPPWVDEV